MGEIAPYAEETVGEKEIACCVRGYHVYEDIWAAAIREVLVCSTELTNVGKIFVVKLYSRKIFSYIFCVRKYFQNENKANYDMHAYICTCTQYCCSCIQINTSWILQVVRPPLQFSKAFFSASLSSGEMVSCQTGLVDWGEEGKEK